MNNNGKPVELYRAYRPDCFERIKGQDAAVKTLQTQLTANRVPHVLLFSGPSGVGKTTMARIVAKELGCGDIIENNMAIDRGIDVIRDIRRRMGSAALRGKVKAYILDEVAQLTSEGQVSCLKILEDTPSHVYFFLCTTDPHKLKKAILTRCTEVRLAALSNDDLEAVISDHFQQAEWQSLPEIVVAKIIEVAEGSPRKALVLADQVRDLGSEEEMVDAVQSADLKKQAIDLARALFEFPKPSWPRVAKILASLEEDPEAVRRLVLGYARSILLKGGKIAPIARRVIGCFQGHLFDDGAAGLAADCWDAVNG